mmetsp:Transcript_556/g.1383  ORF Transcript_556/g.1383 Transcript_556/m.1383 type:complete len:250 (-) Transcript_556:1658-2407(-)
MPRKKRRRLSSCDLQRTSSHLLPLRSGFQRGYGGEYGLESSGDQTTAAKPGKKVWQPSVFHCFVPSQSHMVALQEEQLRRQDGLAARQDEQVGGKGSTLIHLVLSISYHDSSGNPTTLRRLQLILWHRAPSMYKPPPVRTSPQRLNLLPRPQKLLLPHPPRAGRLPHSPARSKPRRRLPQSPAPPLLQWPPSLLRRLLPPNLQVLLLLRLQRAQESLSPRMRRQSRRGTGFLQTCARRVWRRSPLQTQT